MAITKEEVQTSSYKQLKGIWSHLKAKRKAQLVALLVVMLGSAMTEVLTIGSMVPFLSAITDPSKLQDIEIINYFSKTTGTDKDNLVIVITLAFAILVAISALVRLGNTWINGRLAASVGSEISCEAYRKTLYQPYTVHLHRNSSEVITNTITQTGRTVSALNAILQVITSAFVATGIIAALILVDGSIACIAIAIFGTAYILIGKATKQRLKINSLRIAVATEKQLKTLQEGIGSIRDVLIQGNQEAMLATYRNIDLPQRLLIADSAFIRTSPRYILETVGMLGIAILGCSIAMNGEIESTSITVLGTLAFGAQRLMPTMQQIYGGWAAIKNYSAAISGVLGMLEQETPRHISQSTSKLLISDIEFTGVSFQYREKGNLTLNQVDIRIRRGEKIGIIGATGSGKSTFLDVLMGLLEPQEGTIKVNGEDIYEEKNQEFKRTWMNSIAHVPQQIYLNDATINENITFGVQKTDSTQRRMQDAAKQAEISTAIEMMPDKYETIVGENGMCLSGGQKQRIGLARAFYKRCPLLVLDEATSALDTSTEARVMSSIKNLDSNITVLMIAHRLSTLEQCTRIIRFENGKLIEDGPPGKVLNQAT